MKGEQGKGERRMKENRRTIKSSDEQPVCRVSLCGQRERDKWCRNPGTNQGRTLDPWKTTNQQQLPRHSNIPDMASDMVMPGPICLIESKEGQLMVKQEALEILSAITQPVVVVAIVGLYRTGKSYLMNKLAGKKKGFSVGSTVQSHTKGIWMWCVPHPEKPGHTLVLLDTEGLGDVEKVDAKNDTQIFVLAILLSSTLVYNTMNKIDQGAIDLLHNVTELTDLLRSRKSPDLDVEDASDIVSFFPDLVWTLRDFYLSLETDGQLMTADEYLENSLKTKQGSDQRTQTFNLPRLCIQKFFPTKKCFVFDSPTHKKLSQLETLQDDELSLEFVQQVAEFSSHIYTKSKIKTLPGGIKVTGPRLESLVLTYVSAINSGALPCMENAVLALTQRENSAAVQKALAHYDELMVQKVQLPTETLQELLELHRASEREAIEIFTKNSFKDEDQSFQKELQTLLDVKQKDICKQNEEASSDRCSVLLQDIFGPLEEEVKQGLYSKPGGHNLYLQKTEELKKKYHQQPRKGTQVSLILSINYGNYWGPSKKPLRIKERTYL
ncbi:Guanylate-binding protein 5 [Sciurus carolinensis]|uniref:Guanylate-binding protein 5 n=1 Tax=Sciurus carolinensis TaxID=30640 RepID=A0AA41MRM6_SCICA|nr:Guanylate-binding protein 5 [Sciurus carolinensis]